MTPKAPTCIVLALQATTAFSFSCIFPEICLCFAYPNIYMCVCVYTQTYTHTHVFIYASSLFVNTRGGLLLCTLPYLCQQTLELKEMTRELGPGGYTEVPQMRRREDLSRQGRQCVLDLPWGGERGAASANRGSAQSRRLPPREAPSHYSLCRGTD